MRLSFVSKWLELLKDMPASDARRVSPSWLKLNVGFLMHGAIGMMREFPLALPAITFEEGLTVAGIEGSLQLSRTDEGVWAQGLLRMPFWGECSRCLCSIPRLAEIQLEELFALPGLLPRSGPTEFVIHEDGILDLLPLLRAELLIITETSALCREDCAGLCPNCGQNRNEILCDCAAPLDPRWSSLAEKWEKKNSNSGDYTNE